jgi:hypothetical protein
LFERDVGAGVKHEATIASPTLALGTRQGIFLTRLRMQEHWKIAAHRPETVGEHLLGAGAHDHPIDIGNRYTQQAVANRSANFIDLHCNTSDGPEG